MHNRNKSLSSSSSKSRSSNSKISSHSEQKNENSQKNNAMIDPSQLSIYQDINKKTFFLPGMNQNLNTSKMKLPVPYGVGAPMVLPIAKQSPNLNPQNEAQEKILKDQNFLSSDDKLYESIIHHGLSLKNIFAECQFSEKLLGSYLFRAIKKNVFDNNTIIFEDGNTAESNSESNNNYGIKGIELIESNIDNIIKDNEKVPKINDTSDIFKKIMEMKEKKNIMIDS